MPISISVKNVPDEIMEKLRKRAKRHHRSLQGELMAILDEATGPAELSVDQAEARLRALGLGTRDDSLTWIRELRDASLTAKSDPVLAEIWDNERDAAYDRM